MQRGLCENGVCTIRQRRNHVGTKAETSNFCREVYARMEFALSGNVGNKSETRRKQVTFAERSMRKPKLALSGNVGNKSETRRKQAILEDVLAGFASQCLRPVT